MGIQYIAATEIQNGTRDIHLTATRAGSGDVGQRACAPAE